MNRALLVSCAATLLISLSGCSGAGGTVAGRVTVDGQPLTKGNISFAPEKEGPAAIGTIDGSGNYNLQVGTINSIPPGKYKVTVVAVEPIPPIPGQPEAPPKLLTPPKYNNPTTSDLTAEVKPGSNKFDFDLKSMP